MRFACHVADNLDKLRMTGEGQPELPEVVPAGTDTFRAMSYNKNPELWSNVNLQECFVYLRGSTKLKVPEKWKALVPKSFPRAP